MIRILLVDDETILRRATRRFLEDEDRLSVVAEAGDGRAALAAVRQHSPDVVLLDLHMPDMTGLEVLQVVMDSPGVRPVVIMLTADTDERYARMALRQGAMGYLLKYSCADTLLPAIQSGCGGRPFVSPEFHGLLEMGGELRSAG